MKQACCIIFIALWFAIPLQLVAQDDEPRLLCGKIADAVTGDYVHASIDLLDADSTVVSRASLSTTGDIRTMIIYTVKVPHQGKYILRCKADNAIYNVWYKDLDITFGKREYQLPDVDIKMRRRLFTTDVLLDSVFVTATKVKFYFDKDTLIYDATAFELRESAVLEDLIRQMPGVELHEDGQIIVNGRSVDALLLNGKDFFNEDRTTILNNLPHYMIKKVKVYDKTPDSKSKIARERTYNGYVMDVRLKKQYESTWVGNLALGYGTDSHYSAKLFLMRFNKNYRVSGSLLADDVSDPNDPASGSDYSMPNLSSDPFELERACINYNYDHPNGVVALNGYTQIAYTLLDKNGRSKSQTYYASDNVFSLGTGKNKMFDFGISAHHTWDLFTLSPWRIKIEPDVFYRRLIYHTRSFDVSFNNDVADSLGAAWLDTLYNASSYRLAQLNAVNREVSRLKSCSEELRASLQLSKSIKIPHSNDAILLKLYLSHRNSDYKGFSRQGIEYISASQIPDDYRNRYNDKNSTEQSVQFTSSYDYKLNSHLTITPSYSLQYNHNKSDNDHFLLNLLGEEWANDTAPLGALPSEELLFKTIDAFNSNHSYTTDWLHNATFDLKYAVKKKVQESSFEREWIGLNLNLPLILQHNNLGYNSVQTDTATHRSLTMFNPSLTLRLTSMSKAGASVSFSFKQSHTPVAMTRLLNITNTSNPLYISRSNPELAQLSSSENYRLTFDSNSMKHFRRVTLSASYTNSHKYVVTESVYDRTTGVTTARPVNIDGNWSANASLRKSISINSNGFGLNINPEFSYTYNKNIGLYNLNPTSEPQISEIHNNNFTFSISTSYSWYKNGERVYIRLDPRVTHRRSTSSRPGFEAVSATDVNCSIRANCEFAHNWAVYWSSMLESHFGYRYSDMSKTLLQACIEVRKDIMRSSISLIVNDIFHSNRSSWLSVSSSTRTERITDVQGQFFMLRWLYRLSQKKEK